MGLNLCQRETHNLCRSQFVSQGDPTCGRSLYQQSAAQHAATYVAMYVATYVAMYVATYVATAGATNPTIHTSRIYTQDGQNRNYYRSPPPPRTNKKPAFSY
jgi:hypothetical protein